MFVKNFFIFFLIASLISLQTIANDTIIVTADRIHSTLDKSPSDIIIFQEEEIKKAATLPELLASQSDLSVVESGPGGSSTSLFLRGSDSAHTLVIIDGITMNDPSNPNRQFDWGRFSLNNIERIEILKGSQGLLYGSNAVGGVVLITTKKARKEIAGSASTSYGTFQTLNSAVNVQQKLNNTSLSFGVDHLKTHGFSAANANLNSNAESDGEKRSTISLGVSQLLDATNELFFNYRYVNDRVDLDKNGGAGNDDPNDFQWTEQQFLKAGYNHSWDIAETQFFFTRSLHHRTHNILRDPVHTEESSTITKGIIESLNINHTQYTTNDLTQNINFSYQHEKDQLKNSSENLSLFFYNRFEMGHGIFNIGFRIDRNQIFKEHLTYKAAYLHNLHFAQIKMSYSTGFQAPGLNQLFDPTYGNKNLKPEKSQSAEFGIDVPISTRHKYTGNIFYTEIRNRLSYDPTSYVNLNSGMARIIGFENNFKSLIASHFESILSATWLSARDMTARQKLARRPNLNAKLALNYGREAQNLSVEAEYVGRRRDIDNLNNSVTLPSHALFHLNYYYSFSQKLIGFFKIKNIFNKDYENVWGYGTGGRAITSGITYDF